MAHTVMERGFSLEWYAGPSAQLDLTHTGEPGAERYELRYSPPFRATLRARAERRPVGRGELKPISEDLDEAVGGGGARSADATAAAALVAPGRADLERIGSQLYQCVVPPWVRADMRPDGLFLELGVDERLVDLPWELMYDGEDFLCNKHFIGRYVNVGQRPEVSQAPETRGQESGPTDFRILLIAVPRPMPRDDAQYAPLQYADAEATAIVETTSDISNVRLELLRGRDATYKNVWEALQQGPYHIIHYTGHAHFDAEEPDESALVLYDRDMRASALRNFFGEKPSLVCFMNGCETGVTEPAWKEGFDIYGLGWAFLETGSYLIGSRWKVDDETAKRFATRFYRALLDERLALGQAVTAARRECFQTLECDDIGWASYVLYGDPRMGFRRHGRFARPGSLATARTMTARSS